MRAPSDFSRPITAAPLMLLAALVTLVSTGSSLAAQPTRTEDARPQRASPDWDALARTPAPPLPRVNPSPPGPDIGALVRSFRLPGTDPQASKPVSGLLIFVSLSMPAASLRLLAAQAERTGATLLLRGLKNDSMTQTLTAVQPLIGSRKVRWLIDPEAFIRHEVHQVPAFVLTDVNAASAPPCAGACVPAQHHAIAGDVSLDHALQALMRRHPEARARALPYLQRLTPTP